MGWHGARAPAATLLAAAALRWAAPSPESSVRALGSTTQATDVGAPLVAAASLLAWLLLVQLVLVGLLTLAAQLPGSGGRIGAAALRRSAPAGVRRAVALALGVGLVLGSGAGAATAGPASAPAAATPLSLDWPVAEAGLAADPSAVEPVSFDWPSAGRAPAAVTPPTSATTTAAATPPSTRPRAAEPAVVVAPGDSLWVLAQASLPPGATDAQVAASWPTWWAANREVIGQDPDLLLPGQALRPPP